MYPGAKFHFDHSYQIASTELDKRELNYFVVF